jgi:hypothetical protein
MTSVPALVEAPVLVVDDGTLLDGAASVWAVMTFAGDLPATPENKAALAKARTVFLSHVAEFGFSAAELDGYLAEFRTPADWCNNRGSPPGA